MKVYGLVAAVFVALVPKTGLADDLTSGIVLCYVQGSSLEQANPIVGSSWIEADLATQDLRYAISPSTVSMSAAEVPFALQVGIVGGYAFYDREVELGTDQDLGVSGQRIRAWLGASIEACRLVVEMDTCARSDNPDFTVSCSDSLAQENEGQEGENF